MCLLLVQWNCGVCSVQGSCMEEEHGWEPTLQYSHAVAGDVHSCLLHCRFCTECVLHSRCTLLEVLQMCYTFYYTAGIAGVLHNSVLHCRHYRYTAPRPIQSSIRNVCLCVWLLQFSLSIFSFFYFYIALTFDPKMG